MLIVLELSSLGIEKCETHGHGRIALLIFHTNVRFVKKYKNV